MRSYSLAHGNEDDNQPDQMGSMTQDVYVGEPSKDFSRWHLRSEDIIEELEHDLKGEILLDNKWVKKGKKLMNDDGIKETITVVRSYVNKFIFLSKLSSDDIESIMKHFDVELIILLNQKAYAFDIDEADLGLVREIIIMLIYSSLTRGLDGWTMDSVGKTIKIREAIMPQEQKRRGMISGFFGRGD